MISEVTNKSQNVSAIDSEAAWQNNIRNSAPEEQVKKLASEFESIFMQMVLKAMRDTIPKDGLLNGGNAENIYQSMLDTEYAKQCSSTQRSDLRQMLEKQLLEAMPEAKAARDSIDKMNAQKHYQMQMPS